MNVLKRLWGSRKVRLALLGAVQSIVFALIPDFPAEVWQAINVLLLAVIAGIAVEDAAEKVGKNNVRILPTALEGNLSSMKEADPTTWPSHRPTAGVGADPAPSVRAWTPPPE